MPIKPLAECAAHSEHSWGPGAGPPGSAPFLQLLPLASSSQVPTLAPTPVPKDENLQAKRRLSPKQVSRRMKWMHHRTSTCFPSCAQPGWETEAEADGNIVVHMTSPLWVQEWTLGPRLAFASVADFTRAGNTTVEWYSKHRHGINNANLTLLLTNIMPPGLCTHYHLICADERVWENWYFVCVFCALDTVWHLPTVSHGIDTTIWELCGYGTIALSLKGGALRVLIGRNLPQPTQLAVSEMGLKPDLTTAIDYFPNTYTVIWMIQNSAKNQQVL